jgi:hypothetical protein
MVGIIKMVSTYPDTGKRYLPERSDPSKIVQGLFLIDMQQTLRGVLGGWSKLNQNGGYSNVGKNQAGGPVNQSLYPDRQGMDADFRRDRAKI